MPVLCGRGWIQGDDDHIEWVLLRELWPREDGRKSRLPMRLRELREAGARANAVIRDLVEAFLTELSLFTNRARICNVLQ